MTTILATTRSRRFRPVLATYAAFAAVTALTLGTLTGCASEPEPTPSATPAFASEAEAFAAAEEVYRAYNEALNRVDQDPRAEDPLRYLAGEALEVAISDIDTLASAGLDVVGAATLTVFDGEMADIEGQGATIVAFVCLDVSGVTLIDAAGTNVTPPERGNIVATRVTFSGGAEQLLITKESSAEAESC